MIMIMMMRMTMTMTESNMNKGGRKRGNQYSHIRAGKRPSSACDDFFFFK